MALFRYIMLLTFLFGTRVTSLQGAAWYKAQSPHFLIYSSYSGKETRRYMAELEKARKFFEVYWGAETLPQSPQLVVAFRSEKEFSLFQKIPNSIADLIRAGSVHYVVTTGLELDSRYTLYHEYARCLLRHTYASLPWWIENGAAEVYSSLRLSHSQAVLGGDVINRSSYSYVDRAQFIDLRDLVHMEGTTMGKLNNRSQAIATGESWAFVQMLMFTNPYADQYPVLLAHLARGETAEQAFLTVYHRTFTQVRDDFSNYFEKGKWAKTHITLNIEANPEILLTQAAPEEVSRIKAHLLTAMTEESTTPHFFNHGLNTALRTKY
jgi:hypothetical protein